jgi:hypothetical protein
MICERASERWDSWELGGCQIGFESWERHLQTAHGKDALEDDLSLGMR